MNCILYIRSFSMIPHPHIGVSRSQFFQHLREALLACLLALSPRDPSYIVVTLIRRAGAVTLPQAAPAKRGRNIIGDVIDVLGGPVMIAREIFLEYDVDALLGFGAKQDIVSHQILPLCGHSRITAGFSAGPPFDDGAT